MIKTEVPLDCDDPVNQDLQLQKYGERIEKLSQQDKLSKFCMDAGFLNVVEIGQYFMTEDTAESSQFRTVACREYTLPREEETSQPKGWIQENTKIGPVSEVATCYLHGTYGVEIRIWSLNRDNTHSWVRISHGSNRFVVEYPGVQLEDYASKLDAKDFACRSKTKAKPQRREPAGSPPRIVPIGKRTWTDVEPGKYSFSDYEVSKKVMYLLRHSQHVHREEDGAVQFWRIKENLQEHFPHSPHWSDSKWKACLAGGGSKKTIQYCTDSLGTIVYFRALQGHSGRNLIDPSLQDNLIIRSNFFEYIHHVGCALNLHSIISSGLISADQSLSKRQTVFFLLVDPMDTNHKDPDVIDLSVPRHAQYLHKAWKNHQDTFFWVDINLAIEKGLKFYQTRSNAIILQETLPAYCIPKVVRMETGEVTYEKVYASPRPPPKISLKHDWMKELGSEVARQPEGEVARQANFFQPTQPIPNPIRDRTGRPVVKDYTRTVQDGRKTSRSQEIDANSFHEESVSSERTERPVIETSVIQARSSEDSKDPNVGKAHERTRRLVFETNTENVPDSSKTSSFHESETFNVGDETLRKRTERSVADHDNLSHEQTMVNEADMDFRIPGLPHSVVKHAQSTSVRELIQKIESYPDRHALQQDLRQNQAYNPFSPES